MLHFGNLTDYEEITVDILSKWLEKYENGCDVVCSKAFKSVKPIHFSNSGLQSRRSHKNFPNKMGAKVILNTLIDPKEQKHSERISAVK